MKKSIIIICVAVVFSLMTGCRVESNTKRSYFALDEKRCIVLPVRVGDSVSGNMLFDTGSTFGFLTLDSTFCAENSLFEGSTQQGKRVDFSLNTWAGHLKKYRRSRLNYNHPITMNMGGSNIQFDRFSVLDTKRDFAVKVDGLLGFSKNDTTHVWELNFGDGYLEIHQAAGFEMPDDCFVLPLVEGNWNDLPLAKGGWNDFPYVKFPMKVKNTAGDTVTVDEIYLVDTGLTQDIVLTTNAKSIGFFNDTEDVLPVTSAAGYRNRYVVGAEMFDHVKIDSLRIYTDGFAQRMIRAGYSGILGLNFLKRFNLFFDFKNMQLGFQPTGKKFERAIDPNVRKFYYSASFTEDQRYIVTLVADTKDNPFKEAGLRAGDEITALDGVGIKDWLSGKEPETKEKKSSARVIDVVRNGEKLQITYQRNDDGWVGE